MSYRELIPQSAAAFLNLRHLPARLDVEQAAALLGHRPDHIAILVRCKMLKPLGDPAANAPKMFALCEVLEKANDRDWLDKASRQLSRYWREQNHQRKPDPGLGATTELKEAA